jgi:ubiquinone/menaquinone biosynthesis C-methylase UbiE
MEFTYEVEKLNNRIDEIDQISAEIWQSSLNNRKRKELEFHDRDRDKIKEEEAKAHDTSETFYGNRKYYSVIKRLTQFQTERIARESKGKIVLDYACGNGDNAILAAKAGACLSMGLDVSSVSVKNARSKAIDQGITEGIRFFQADAENTMLPDNSIDVIICSGMLHHLDLSYAIPELRRILKPGGKILVSEALDYNPAIKLYRMLTPNMRTDWEKAHILDLADVAFISRFLAVEDVRYWHVVGYLGGIFPWLSPVVDAIDRVLERISYIQRMAWIFTFALRKPAE